MSTFTDNDTRLLDKTLVVREKIIDKLLTQELPTSARDIDAFTNLLESVDRSVLGKAKIKIEDTNARANEETKDMLRSLLLDLHKDVNTNNYLSSSEPKDHQEFRSTDMKVNEGELIHKVDEIDVKAVLANN